MVKQIRKKIARIAKVPRSLRGPMIAAAVAAPMIFASAHAESKGPVHALTSDIRSWFESGKASWYGIKSKGHHTANGDMFDPNGLTAAHRTLPFGSLVRVTNTSNKKSVIVKINDRGPVTHSRVLDLSPAAARELGFMSAGTAAITMELLTPVSVAELHEMGPAR